MKHIAIYNPNLHTMGGGEKVCLALAEALSNDFKVTLVSHRKTNLKACESYFGVDLHNVNLEVIPLSRVLRKIYSSRFVPDALSRLIKNYELYCKLKKKNYDFFVNNAFNTELPSPSPVGIYMCMFPHKILDPKKMSAIKGMYLRATRVIARILMHSKQTTWLETYKLITANSKFTQGYIERYWGRDSVIIYPVCDEIAGDVSKEKIILNVGRFFQNDGIQHHKRQDFLIDEFIKRTDLHAQGWQLHLAGTVNENTYDMAYVIDLLKRADGYPVYIHPGLSLEKLQDLYRKASIYWHATGYGVKASKFPERQEHFGISTVEAMSAGAIPVVINTAGQKEIIEEGVNGFLWDSPKELYDKTNQAIQNITSLSENVHAAARKYDRSAFKNQCWSVFKALS